MTKFYQEDSVVSWYTFKMEWTMFVTHLFTKSDNNIGSFFVAYRYHDSREMTIYKENSQVKVRILTFISKLNITSKVSVFGVFLVHIFPHLDWILRDTSISPYSVQMRENTDQKNSKYRHFSSSDILLYYSRNPYNCSSFKVIFLTLLKRGNLSCLKTIDTVIVKWKLSWSRDGLCSLQPVLLFALQIRGFL